MLKKVLQKLTPTPLLNWYKKRQYIRILSDFKTENQPDLHIALKLADPESVAVDIGANIGLYTKELAPHSKKVISIEPVPFTCSMLKNTVRHFGLDNVEVHQLGISDSGGTATISVPEESGTKNFYRASLQGAESSSGQQIEISITTIDDLLLDQAEDISFIKCDVEGHELACIKGAEQFLQKNKAAWLIEISGDPDRPGSSAHQLFEIMKEHNYQVFLYKDDILKPRQAGDQSVNYFFLKEEHINMLQEQGFIL